VDIVKKTTMADTTAKESWVQKDTQAMRLHARFVSRQVPQGAMQN
jgi:hypothetical protein